MVENKLVEEEGERAHHGHEGSNVLPWGPMQEDMSNIGAFFGDNIALTDEETPWLYYDMVHLAGFNLLALDFNCHADNLVWVLLKRLGQSL